MVIRRVLALTRPLAEAQVVAEETSGFLGRWARRKTDVLQGKPLDEPVAGLLPLGVPAPVASPVATVSADTVAPQSGATAEQPALSMDDVKLLTKDSDFKPFMARDVGSDLRNAAMKKLFSDPHFNVMDGLDIYIDDYSKSDPIPDAMLRGMTSSKFLKLFDDDDDNKDKVKDKNKQGETASRESANIVADQIAAYQQNDSDAIEPLPAPQINSSQYELLKNSGASQQDHDHSHLRLQPDHAASEPDARRST